jgi:hypothetical protein
MGLDARGFRVLGGDDIFGDTGTSCDSSAESDVAARLSRSSRRRLSFLPMAFELG